jgi:hypothetical protein
MKIATTSARTQKRYMLDITARMMAPARARPPPVSSPGDRLMRRTADTPTQKAAGPSSIPKGQTSRTAATPNITARTARTSATGGPGIGGASMTATGLTLLRNIALPTPAVAAAAPAPTTSRPMNATGPGRYVPQIEANVKEASRSAASRTPPATKSAPVTVMSGRDCDLAAGAVTSRLAPPSLA